MLFKKKNVYFSLHCVRGRYPEALLKAWDKFDCQKGSENDRPGKIKTFQCLCQSISRRST